MFRKILIANRGEIAVRIARACRDMGVRSVAVYSDVDRASLHVRLADEAYPIGPAPSRESYLVIDKIIGAARYAACDAIHPGYGFLAENPALARACLEAGITFIGPTAEAMEKLGSKTAARHVAREVNVPTVPGTLDPIESVDELIAIARKTGFPVVLKAVAGGGGKGMRSVERESELAGAWRDASSEARNAFDDGRLYLEKYLLKPRHIEIQVLADQHGNIVYLGERECSVQRRHQKVIEEAPSPIMTADLRRQMGEAAVKLARAGRYTNAGTVEFLVDAECNFYFLEMNTRLQVEHPVTEMVTATDLVKLQIQIAAGERLPLVQEDVALSGHAIECRIYAEDPDNNFFPSPGKILGRRVPSGPGIRLDDGVYAGWTVPNDYDPMLGKLIAWGSDRAEAIARLQRALDEYYATGIKTNVGLFRRILATADFQSGDIYTRWLDDYLRDTHKSDAAEKGADSKRAESAALFAAALCHAGKDKSAEDRTNPEVPAPSRWKTEGRREQWIGSRHDDTRSHRGARGEFGMKVEIALDGKNHEVELAKVGERLRCTIDGAPLEADAVQIAPGIYSILIDGQSLEVRVEPDGAGVRLTVGDREWRAEVRDPREWRRNRGGAAEAEGRQQVSAPMPGKIVRVLVASGDSVDAKQGLFVVEAMKMQNEIRSPKSGKVERLLVTEGQTVNAGEALAIIV